MQIWMREHNRLCDELSTSLRVEFMTSDEQFTLIRKARPSSRCTCIWP